MPNLNPDIPRRGETKSHRRSYNDPAPNMGSFPRGVSRGGKKISCHLRTTLKPSGLVGR
jgi:hypothetical protein